MDKIPNRALLVTALPVERAAVARHLGTGVEERHRFGTIYGRYRFGSWDVLLGEVGPGNASAALETERAITHFNPQVALFSGIAGGIKDVALGDVVVATKVYGYEYGADRLSFQPRPDVGLGSYPIIQEARAAARAGDWSTHLPPSRVARASMPTVFVAPIAAGEKVVKASAGAVATLLRQNYGDALAVEMEGAGFLRAAYATSTDAVVVRGISDLLDGKAEADAEGWQETASDRAAAFCMELLRRLGERTTADVARVAGGRDDAAGGRGAPADPFDRWVRLRELVPRLYPTGPREREIWSLAGGDISRLDLSEDGRTQWIRAIAQLQKGGGGHISAATLLGRMSDDFGMNYEMQYLQQLFAAA